MIFRAHRLKATAFILFSILWIASQDSASADTLTYDRYAPVYQEKLAAPSSTSEIAPHLLVAPFELLRWPVDKTLVYLEEHHIPKKVTWIYDRILDQGITPHFNLISLTSPSVGMDVDFVRLLRQREHFPDLTLEGWVDYSDEVIFEGGTRVGWDQIAGTGFHVFGMFKYEMREDEHFYGVGPDTSAGEGAAYEMEVTTLQPSIGYSWGPRGTFDFKFSYQNINISDGQKAGRAQIDEIVDLKPVPGIEGDELITFETEYTWDSRDHKEASTTGGLRRFNISFNEGLDDSQARYFKYQVELSQYLKLWSKRRILVFHFLGEHNDEVNQGDVPFHQMAKLGGYGVYPRLSRTLRAFDFNRFFDESAALFNIEYRYTVWEYRDMKIDAAIFWDEGQVFGEFSEFQFKDFRESYGLGFRFSLANNILLTFEVAHGDEGTNYYVKSKAPF